MRSTRPAAPPTSALLLATAIAAAWGNQAEAQQPAQGFAVERLYLSAPGGGWFVMDDLAQQGGVGGALSFSTGYAHRPLEIRASGGARTVQLVRAQAYASFGLALTCDRFRLFGNLSSPLYLSGRTGVVDGWQFTGPSVSLEQAPDTFSDVQVGVDARVLGQPGGAARLGASARVFIPSGDRKDYLTDGTFRAMGLVLFAGDSGRFQYAAQAGVHVRPLDEAPVPGTPRGDELIFGFAAGARLPLGPRLLVIGPEVFGATAARGLLAADTTAVEGLLTARYEGIDPTSPIRLRIGIGAGIHPRFGAPEWRGVLGVEVGGHLTPK
jgi:hypothetical protein